MKTRLIIGPILLAVVLGAMWLDATMEFVWAFGALCLLGAGMSTQEVCAMSRKVGREPWTAHAVLGSALLILTTILNHSVPAAQVVHVPAVWHVWTGVVMFVLISWLWRGRGEEDFGDIGVTVFAFSYVGGLATFLIAIEALTWNHTGLGLSPTVPTGAPDDGVRALVWVLLSAKSADIFAYFTGKAIGRHKLAPHISPGKTIEGAIGGLIGSILVCCALRPLMGSAGASLSWVWVVVFGAACSMACQAGDLIESRLKRRAGVKDSGELLPEFGGFLDMVDGLLFAAPVGYALLRIVGGGHH